MVSKLSDKNLARLQDALNGVTESVGAKCEEEAVRLACSGKIDQAVDSLEQRLHDDPTNSRLRLWWVWCQLHRGGLPIAALTAPLEDLLDELMSDSSLAYLGTDTFLRAGLLLEQRSKRRLALIMLERASDLAEKAEELSDELQQDILAVYLEVITAEIDGREGRFETGKQLVELKEKKKALTTRISKRKVVKDKVAARQTKEIKQAKAVFSSKTIREEAFAEELRLEEVSPSEALDQIGDIDFLADESSSSEEKSSSRTLLRLAVLAGGAYAVFVFWPMLQFEAVSKDSIARPSTVFVQHEDLKLPALVPKVVAFQGAKLRKVENRLEQLARGRDAEANSETPVADDVDQEMMAALERKADAASQLVALSPPSQLDGFNKPSEQTPELRPERLPPTQVRDLGYTPPPDASPNDRYQRGADGRLYGPPPSIAQGGKQALDGSDLRAYEVQRMSEPVMYRTLTATNVVEAPSVLAATIGRLKADVKVQVVSRMGKWLELRSTGGRRGYIFSQDAVQIVE